MEIKEIIKRLKEDEGFKKWKRGHKNSFLAHVFKMLDDANKGDWQIGFYNEDDTITTFLLTENEIKMIKPTQIFKKPGAKILKIDENRIRIDICKALEIAEKTQVKEYEGESPIKIITILQRLDIGLVYNITYITQSFKILNFKIDANNGKILKKTLESIVDFKLM